MVEVDDVQQPFAGLIVHRARVVTGQVDVGAPVHALVDVDRRKAISRSHTATHMVHKAIRDALGETATQAGSENSPGRFRFDFQATAAVPSSVLADVEAEVNEMLAEDLSVHAEVMTQDQARALGAMALFGEKYGDQVRVVSVGDWTRELCGGTHAQRSGQLGLVKLLGESSIGAGVRRVEALVGTDAFDFLAREHALVGQLTEVLKVRREELPDRVAAIVARLRDAEREIEAMRTQQVLSDAAALADSAQDVFGVRVVTRNAGDGIGADDLRALALDVRGRHGRGSPGRRGPRRRGQGAPGGRRRHERRGAPLGGPGQRPRPRGGRSHGRWRRGQGRRRPGRRHRRGTGRRSPRPAAARRRRSGHPRLVRTGVRLGVDVGSVRVGVAASDPGGLLATPVVTLARDVERRLGRHPDRRAGPGARRRSR